MKQIEAIKRLYESWKENERFQNVDEKYTSQEIRLMFLANGIIGLTTYDDELDIEFGKMILETMIQIKNKTTFEYIKDQNNYRNYILSCNLLNGWLDWGGSIRGAWFDYHEGKFTPSEFLSNVGYDENYIKLNEEFMDWFIDFLLDKQ